MLKSFLSHRWAHAGCFLAATLTVGCQAPGAAGPATEDGWSLSRLKFWDREEDDLASIDGVRGPLERVLQQNAAYAGKNRFAPPEGVREFDEAKALFESGDTETALRQFKRIAKKYKDTTVEEDALFYVGECYFAQGQYSKTQDAYDALLKKYPAPRQLDLMTQRLFDIARQWLEFPEMVASSEIQQVNMERPKDTPPPAAPESGSNDPSRVVPIIPNLWDKSRPLFDTDGHALQALRTIWLNDPTGPLADDALMMSASHHLRKGDYLEADRLYEIIRKDYPKSPHLQNAFILGSHVKLMAYQGPAYDGTSLADAGELAESTLRIYPQHPDRERLLAKVRAIEEAKAAQEWENVEFWQKKGKPLSIAACCREVIRLYPNSTYAAKARQTLAELEAAAE